MSELSGEQAAADFGTGTRHRLETNTSHPAVFMFQPLEYELVSAERIEEWERLLRERVGLIPSGNVSADMRMMRSGLPCVSFCGSGGGMDDCDEI